MGPQVHAEFQGNRPIRYRDTAGGTPSVVECLFYDSIRSQILILAIVSRDPFFGPVDNALDNLHI